MAQQTINIGAAPDDGTGDTIRVGGDKINDNFDELYDETLKFKGSTDCSANPNYPAALKGDSYRVSVAGKIGGASGKVVEVSDLYYALADNAGGTEAAVGTSWDVLQGNITGSLGIAVEDEGVSEGTGLTTLNFTGAGVSVTVVGSEAEVIIPGGGGGVDVEDEGVAEATGATVLNFVGAGVTAADQGGGVVDVTIPGGGASALDDLSDVVTAGAASGDVLTYDGAQWEPVAPSAGGTTELDYGPPTLATHATERKTAASFTASTSDVTGKGLRFSLNPTGVNDKVIGRFKTPPSTPFQIDVRVRQTPHNATGEAGIMLYNTTNSRSLRLFQLTTGQFHSQQWSAFETFNAGIASSPTGIAFDLHGWLRVTVDGSGNVAFFFSTDGAYFKALGTTTLATYLTATGGSLDEIGVYARASGSGGTSGATFHYYDES